MKRLFFWMIGCCRCRGSRRRRLQPFSRPRETAAANGKYRTAAVRRGDIKLTVNSTGTVQPVLSVQVGSFVSGPDSEGLRGLQRQGQKGPAPGGDRSADLQGPVQAGQSRAGSFDRRFGTGQGQARSDGAGLEAGQRSSRNPGYSRCESYDKAIADTDYDLAKATFETAKANVTCGQGDHRAEQGRLGPGGNQPELHQHQVAGGRQSSSTAKSIRARPWPRSSRRP